MGLVQQIHTIRKIEITRNISKVGVSSCEVKPVRESCVVSGCHQNCYIEVCRIKESKRC